MLKMKLTVLVVEENQQSLECLVFIASVYTYVELIIVLKSMGISAITAVMIEPLI